MKVTTDITRTDLIKFNLRFIVGSSATYKMLAIISLAVFTFISWKSGLPDSNFKWGILIGGSFLTGFAAILVNFLFCLTSILLTSKKSNGIIGIHYYELLEEGLLEKTAANESVNKWEGIQSVKVVGSNLLIQISSYLFHVFPQRCFDSQEHFESFKHQAEKYFTNSRN